MPLRLLSVVNLDHRNSFFGVARPATHYDEIATHEADKMLVAAQRCVIVRLWRSHPVPCAITVLTETPNVVQSCHSQLSLRSIMVFLGFFSASEDNHHTQCRTFFANCSRMVDAWTGHDLVLKLILLPCEWSFENIEQPHIILCLVARVSCEYDQVRLVEQHRVSVALPRRTIFICDFDDLPYRSKFTAALLFAEVEDVQFVFEQTLRARGSSSVYYHLHFGHHHCRMGSTLRGHKLFFEVYFGPSRLCEVK